MMSPGCEPYSIKLNSGHRAQSTKTRGLVKMSLNGNEPVNFVDDYGFHLAPSDFKKPSQSKYRQSKRFVVIPFTVVVNPTDLRRPPFSPGCCMSVMME